MTTIDFGGGTPSKLPEHMRLVGQFIPYAGGKARIVSAVPTGYGSNRVVLWAYQGSNERNGEYVIGLALFDSRGDCELFGFRQAASL